MQYKTLVDYETVSRLKSEISVLTPGLWMLDLDPTAQGVLLGPFDTVAEAHDSRDNLGHFGDRYGRYLWLVSKHSCETFKSLSDKIQHIEISIDTIPLEVVSMKIKHEGINEWFRLPRGRKAVK